MDSSCPKPYSINGQVRQTDQQETEMWKSCDNSKQKDSGKSPSQLQDDICNIWAEPRGKEKQEHLQDRGKISLFSASIKPADMRRDQLQNDILTCFTVAANSPSPASQRVRKKVARGQEMASFLALPALGCLLLCVRVSGDPISQTSLSLLPTFPSCCSQHPTTWQGKEKTTNVHLSHRQQLLKSDACAGEEQCLPFCSVKT